jgi:hypothetical protein
LDDGAYADARYGKGMKVKSKVKAGFNDDPHGSFQD